MDTVKKMRQNVKKYIETADEKVVKMMHAMLEADAETSWWDSMPENIKIDVEKAIIEADNGDTVPDFTIQKRMQKWLAK